MRGLIWFITRKRRRCAVITTAKREPRCIAHWDIGFDPYAGKVLLKLQVRAGDCRRERGIDLFMLGCLVRTRKAHANGAELAGERQAATECIIIILLAGAQRCKADIAEIVDLLVEFLAVGDRDQISFFGKFNLGVERNLRQFNGWIAEKTRRKLRWVAI